ncbi:PREDICTED: staphylococcal nuclease domain-containing protein 1-like [Priapulus caudatus]|uniref:Staphylococcal nuclease domain-containing protein 1-like n=1 Tax=Priapulus caudatus TaxID=37621 RepID=A0ABM1EX80_PRICU|nr:PREDICTED: staphylococcal nuclease domain-containing protein 1-like [Priapulus caudatus]
MAFDMPRGMRRKVDKICQQAQNVFSAMEEPDVTCEQQDERVTLFEDPRTTPSPPGGDQETLMQTCVGGAARKLCSPTEQHLAFLGQPIPAHAPPRPIHGYPPPRPITEQRFAALPTYVGYDAECYVQRNDDEGAVHEMVDTLHDLCAGTEPAPDAAYDSGDPCIARRRDDDLWYRAKVVRQHDGGGDVEVFYVDYGNSETLDVSRLRNQPHLLAQIINIP